VPGVAKGLWGCLSSDPVDRVAAIVRHHAQDGRSLTPVALGAPSAYEQHRPSVVE
jgi:hypothetical protein